MGSDGEWVVERSDGFQLSVPHPGVPVYFGRDPMLPSGQRLRHRYVSRRHFSIEWRPPSLFARQLGRNPTFYSTEFLPLPGSGDTRKELEFRVRDDGSKGDDISACGGNVLFVSPESGRMHRSVVRGIGGDFARCTLHFPEELQLPTFTVRYIAAASNAGQAAAEAIPRVPSGWLDHVVEEEENDGGAKPYVGRGWQGILDSILHEEMRQEQKRQEEAEEGGRPEGSVECAVAAVATTTPATATKPLSGQPWRGSGEMADKGSKGLAAPSQSGMWEWKSDMTGGKDDPRSWTPYPRAVAQLLEKAYCSAEVLVRIPNRLMFGPTSDKGDVCSYSVCFEEASPDGTMVQFPAWNKHKRRPVRRRGGSYVDRSAVQSTRRAKRYFSDDSSDASSSEGSSSSVSSRIKRRRR